MRGDFKKFILNTRSPYHFRILKLKILNFLPTAIFLTFIFLFGFSFFLFVWYSRDLPSPTKVQRREGFSTVILDRNGKVVYDIFQEKNRIPVPFSEIPDYLKKATIAIEDKDFYKHQGFDLKGILRAIFNIVTFRGIQGGSTLTQQLVKNVLLTSEKTLARKIKEFVLAVQIERKYTKDEILQMYLNEAPFGGTRWGVEAAAQGYFGKKTKDLTFLEAVILAGLPQKPSVYSPFGKNPQAYLSRAEEVLRRMREDGYITLEQEYAFRKELPHVKFASPSSEFFASHFVFFVKKKLIEMFGEEKVEKGGLKVTTTLDLELQKKAETILREELEKIKNLQVTNGGLVALNPQNGEILAYVGSKEYDSQDPLFQGKFDVVSLALRQPGSALKPMVYATAFAKGYTPSSVLMDVETRFPGGEGKPDYIPKNYDNKFRGPVQIRFALGNSINVPAVKITALVGVKEVLKTAYEMGLTTLSPTKENVARLGLSLSLGGGEVRLIDLVNAYAVFANRGIKNEVVAILKVEDVEGKIIFEHKKKEGKKVLSPEIAFLISHILQDNNARKEVFGERSYLYLPGKTVAVKTGTTDDKRDNWAIGYTPSFVLGVWVGNNDNSPMSQKLASGATGSAPIWHRVMLEALKNKPDESFAVPENIISLEIDAFLGGLPYPGRPTRREYFIKGTEPESVSPFYQKLKISKNEKNKLANPVEIAQGEYEEKEFIVFKEEDPTSLGENRWQEGIEKWLSGEPNPLYHPPKETSSTSENRVIVKIRKPQDKEQIDSNEITILAEAKALKEIKKIAVYIDEELKKEIHDSFLEETFNLPTGIHQVKIQAEDISGNRGEETITIGVKTSPEPTPTSSPSPSPS